MRPRRLYIRMKRMTRGLNPFLWLIGVVLICIWTMNYKERNQYSQDQRRAQIPSLKQPSPSVTTAAPFKAVTAKHQPVKDSSRETPDQPDRLQKDDPKPINCTESSKRNHYIKLEFRPGRTGNALFQVFCLLSLSKKYCYTAVVERRNRFFKKLLDPVFDIKNIERPWRVDTENFHNLTSVLSPTSKEELTNYGFNWTLRDRCVGYTYLTGQEDYIRSSVQIRGHIKHVVNDWMKKNVARRSPVAIHVRRTDKMTNEQGYDYNDLEWYKPYITNAMKYLKEKYSNLAFVFVSDDLHWCEETFHGADIFFSPCTDVGCDLALVTLCDHVVLTIGTYGWMGAWLGKHKTVIYNTKYVPPRFYKKHFYLPSWVGIQ